MTDSTTPKEVTQAAMTEAGDLLPSSDELAKFWHAIGYSTCWADAAAGKLPPLDRLEAAINESWDRREETYEGDLYADEQAALRNTHAPITPSDRSQQAVVEAVARAMFFTNEGSWLSEQYRDEYWREMSDEDEFAPDEISGLDHFVRHGRNYYETLASAAIAALQPPAADNAIRTEDGLADEYSDAIGPIIEAVKTVDLYGDGEETLAMNCTRQAMEDIAWRAYRAILAHLRTTGQPAIAAARPVGEADV